MLSLLAHKANTFVFGLLLPHFYEVAIPGVVFGLALEWLFPSGERHSLTSRLRGGAFYALYLVSSVLVAALFLKGLAHFGVRPLFKLDLAWTENEHGALGWLGLLIFPLSGVLVYDFFYYWFHRLQHAAPMLWRFHAVHHAIRELNILNVSHHLSEDFFRVPLLLLPMVLVVGVSPPHLIVASFFMASIGRAQHANSRVSFGWLRYLFVEPRFHRVHHSIEPQHCDRNFAANFPLWDVLFATAYWPQKSEWPSTGLAGIGEAKTLRAYLWPPVTIPTQQAKDQAIVSP